MLKIVNDPNVGMPSVLEGGVDLDELCRMAAQEMLAIALETERRAYLDATPRWSTPMATGWWWATGICLSGR